MTAKEQEIQAIEQRYATEYERSHKRHEEQLRRPFLRFLRRLRGMPEPKVTVEQAIEITRDYFVTIEGFSESFREQRLLVTATLQAYLIWPLDRGAGFVSVKVDTTDGRIYDVIAPEMMM